LIPLIFLDILSGLPDRLPVKPYRKGRPGTE